MTHRAEQVMQAVASSITGLATTGANVYSDYAYDVEVDNAPFLMLDQGPEQKLTEYAHGYDDWQLEFYITAHVMATSGHRATLNTIRTEVTKALRADYTLGLAFVQQIEENSATGPTNDAEGQQQTSTMQMTWLVTYRRSTDDPET